MNPTSYAHRSNKSSSCRGKARHATEGAVRAAVAGHYLTYGDVVAGYCCAACGNWHLGHGHGRHGWHRTTRAIDLAAAPAPPTTAFQRAMQAKVAAVARATCGPGRDPDELVAAILGEPVVPGLLSLLTAAQCEDVLLTCEAVHCP